MSMLTRTMYRTVTSRELEDEVEGWDENQLLNTSVDDLGEYFVKKYRIDVPVLDRGGIIVDHREKQIDDSGNPYRINFNPGRAGLRYRNRNRNHRTIHRECCSIHDSAPSLSIQSFTAC